MKRVSLINGKWFDLQKAEKFQENTFWNGSNQISKITKSQFEHQDLYLTASGVWVLNTWSNYQNSIETFEQIEIKQVAEWFVKNEFSDDDIPDNVLKLIKEELKSLEV